MKRMFLIGWIQVSWHMQKICMNSCIFDVISGHFKWKWLIVQWTNVEIHTIMYVPCTVYQKMGNWSQGWRKPWWRSHPTILSVFIFECKNVINIAILHIHAEMVDDLGIDSLLNEVAVKTSKKTSTFALCKKWFPVTILFFFLIFILWLLPPSCTFLPWFFYSTRGINLFHRLWLKYIWVKNCEILNTQCKD